MNEYYVVTIEEVIHPRPGGETLNLITTVEQEVNSAEDVQKLIDYHIPVSLSSGDPMHYDHGDFDEYDIGRIYHYWDDTPDGNVWVDAWVTVEKVEKNFIKWGDLTPQQTS